MLVEAAHEVFHTWDPVESGTCYLSIFFRKEDDDPQNTLHIYMGKGELAWAAGPVIRMGGQSGGAPDEIGVHDGDARVQPAKFKVQEWQHIREVIDVDKLKYEVYLDGKDLGKFNFRNKSHDAIEWLMVGFDGGVGIQGYYDNIEFGLGKGEDAYRRATAVDPAGKLGTTWGMVKGSY